MPLLCLDSETEEPLEVETKSELEYVMVVGIVCLSGIALLILVSLGLMVSFVHWPLYSKGKFCLFCGGAEVNI